MLQIQNDAAALDFDFACNLLLSHFEDRREILRLDAQRSIYRQAYLEARGVIEIAPPISFDDESGFDDDEDLSGEPIRVGSNGINRSEAELMADEDVL